MVPSFIKVHVTPEAKQNSVEQKTPDSYAISVKEPAANGRANNAVLLLLAKTLSVPRGKLWIIKGAKQPHKIIQIKM